VIALAIALHPVLLLAAEAAHEATEHGAESPWGPSVWGLPAFVWHAVNFVIFAAIIFFAAKGGIVAGARAKRERISREIQEAAKLRDEMRAKFEDYDARMKDIDARMNSILSDAKAEGEAEKSRIIEEAKAAAVRMREDARLVADQEIARAKIELQDEQISRAAELAEAILRTNVNKDDQARLSTEFLSRISKGRPA
jgi:F-type H+-transporting ATPase subunit b